MVNLGHPAAFGDFDKARYAALLGICRAASPAWARAHDDFEGAADLAIMEALGSYDVSRGVDFDSFLYLRARSRISTVLARWDRHSTSLTPIDGLSDSTAWRLGRTSPYSPEVWAAAAADVTAVINFAAALPRQQRAVALRIAAGFSISEVAADLGVSLSAVCNALRALRHRAATYFGSTPLAVVVSS